MSVEKPSIGSIVHYQRFGTPGGEHLSKPSPAIIVEVFENNECQLFVMNPNGVYFNRTLYSEDNKPGTWSWPKRT